MTNPTSAIVLTIEDEPAIALMERERLEEAGFVVEVAATGGAGLDCLECDRIDLVLLDHQLPDMSGQDVVHSLGDRIESLPVVIVTARGDESLAVELLKAGVADYLIKDTGRQFIRSLPNTVHACLERFRLKAELRHYQQHLEDLVRERTAELSNTAQQLRQEIAERKQAEEATLAAQQQLLERQRNEKKLVDEELDKLKVELVHSARLATIGKISAQIAHDLRNPLGSVRNAAFYLRGIASHFDGDSADELDDFLSVIEDEVNACNGIIGDLLDTANPKQAVLESVDLGQLVRAEFARFDLASGVQCQFESVPDPYIVRVDPNQWRQVVGNLLANSLHAVGDCGAIEFRAVRNDEFDEMTIRDSGPGVSMEHRESIFDLLFTTKAKGNGLGLAICRQIVEGHGGTIELADPQDGGATFIIRLPRDRRQQE